MEGICEDGHGMINLKCVEWMEITQENIQRQMMTYIGFYDSVNSLKYRRTGNVTRSKKADKVRIM